MAADVRVRARAAQDGEGVLREGEHARWPNGAHTGAQPANTAWLSGRARGSQTACASSILAGGTCREPASGSGLGVHSSLGLRSTEGFRLPCLPPCRADGERVGGVILGGVYSWPLKPFDRAHPVRGYFNDPRISGRSRAFHFGIDISAPNGTPVYAVRGGVVHLEGRDRCRSPTVTSTSATGT